MIVIQVYFPQKPEVNPGHRLDGLDVTVSQVNSPKSGELDMHNLCEDVLLAGH